MNLEIMKHYNNKMIDKSKEKLTFNLPFEYSKSYISYEVKIENSNETQQITNESKYKLNKNKLKRSKYIIL